MLLVAVLTMVWLGRAIIIVRQVFGLFRYFVRGDVECANEFSEPPAQALMGVGGEFHFDAPRTEQHGNFLP